MEELQPISLQTIPDAIRLMNESSRGMSLEYHLDFLGFLSIHGYWNFSYTHSLIRYVDGEPAAIILICTDAEAREAHTLYWGTLPKFRSLKIATTLFDACCQRLYDDGFVMLYGVSVPDRPVRRYRFIQANPQYVLFDMEARTLNLPAPDPEFRVQRLDVATLSQFSIPPGEHFLWSQRHSFLRHAASNLQFFGAYCGDVFKAYAVVRVDASNFATLLDLRSTDSGQAAGFELLRHIFLLAHPGPCIASDVFDQSYSHRLLKAAGLGVKRQYFMLTRDLRATCVSEKFRSA
jgi:hypothetical protein